MSLADKELEVTNKELKENRIEIEKWDGKITDIENKRRKLEERVDELNIREIKSSFVYRSSTPY